MTALLLVYAGLPPDPSSIDTVKKGHVRAHVRLCVEGTPAVLMRGYGALGRLIDVVGEGGQGVGWVVRPRR